MTETLRQAAGELIAEWERTAAECVRLANGPRAGLSDEEPLRTAALVNGKRAADLRALLAEHGEGS